MFLRCSVSFRNKAAHMKYVTNQHQPSSKLNQCMRQ